MVPPRAKKYSTQPTKQDNSVVQGTRKSQITGNLRSNVSVPASQPAENSGDHQWQNG